MIGIYKITNLINNKSYIGQSNNIQRRWHEHISENTNSLIHLAILKYGIENFSFTIIEECLLEQLNEKEIYYIKEYNTLSPNGYNISTGGSNNYEHFHYTSKETVDLIIYDLLYTNDDIITIAQRYNKSFQTIDDIRLGKYHRRSDLSYPLRERKSTKQTNYCKRCGKEIYRESNYCMECFSLIRRTVERPTKEELFKLILTKSFTDIGKIYKVSDNTIRKWCISYNLPSTKKQLKELKLI